MGGEKEAVTSNKRAARVSSVVLRCRNVGGARRQLLLRPLSLAAARVHASMAQKRESAQTFEANQMHLPTRLSSVKRAPVEGVLRAGSWLVLCLLPVNPIWAPSL